MKKLLLFIIPLFLCGCTFDMNRKEIDEINLVYVIAIDYDNGKYTVSALYSSGGGGSPSQSSTSGKEEISNGTGKTPFEAFQNLKLKNKKAISVAQTGFFLIGDGAARNGIDTCLDFLTRDETIKMEALIYIVKDSKADDFLNKAIKSKQTVHEDLKAIQQKQHELVTRLDNTLVNITNDMKQTYSSVLIPYLISKEKSFQIEGYAVFDKLKLKDYLDHDTSSGVNFVKNIIRTYPIYLDNQVGLSLSFAKTKLKSDINSGNVNITIHVDFETNIDEVNTTEDIFTEERLSELTNKQNKYIKKIIKKAVDYSVTTGLDIMQLARIVENQHVKEWKNMSGTWNQSIIDIKYSYVMRSKISRSFIIGNERGSK